MKQNDHPLFARWRYWHQVCYNPNNNDYPKIGGQGIQVKFDDFWDMANWVESNLGLPPLGSSSRLARIDQNGNYAPGNLRWETGSELVGRNSRSIQVTINGQTKCLNQWARESGLKMATVYNRIKRYGWSVERALTTPPEYTTHKKL
jgi:hypothetical protein